MTKFLQYSQKTLSTAPHLTREPMLGCNTNVRAVLLIVRDTNGENRIAKGSVEVQQRRATACRGGQNSPAVFNTSCSQPAILSRNHSAIWNCC